MNTTRIGKTAAIAAILGLSSLAQAGGLAGGLGGAIGGGFGGGMSSGVGRIGGSTMGNLATTQQLDAGHTATSASKPVAQKPAVSAVPAAAAVSGASQAGPASASTATSASKP
jgi:hypothetical protein